MALRQRLDKWLWFARVARTRSLAARLVTEGHVRLNARRIETPAKGVGPGDVLTIALERQVRVLKVVAPGISRGSFPEAPICSRNCRTPGIALAQPCQRSILITCAFRGPRREASAALQKSCKNPWTDLLKRPTALYRGCSTWNRLIVPHYRASPKCRAGEGMFLENFGKAVNTMETRSMAPFPASP